MEQYPQFIDNKRKTLADTLRSIAPNFHVLRVATGYWDLPGTLELIEQIKGYKKIQLLIGQEPLANHLQKKYNISFDENQLFPDSYVSSDLEDYGTAKEINELRETAKVLVSLIKENKMEVKVFRKPRLHAKAYIFGELGDGNSVGIIGSSNFTRAGLTTSQELNFLTYDYKIVEFEPKTENQENGHITWFDELWNDEGAEEWTGNFTEIISNSPVGDKTYGAYDVYIKTLMEVFPDELIDVSPFDSDIEKVLHEFQNQNALNLRRKLDTMGVAMLSDSVGLGKTITAAAIIKQYIHDDKVNIVIIPPASLKQQWVDELESERWHLVEHRDFEVYTQQDSDKIQQLIEKSKERINTRDEIDLFVVDEAHNLRNAGSTRHQQVLELFQENPNAKVLLLTATPINNSLMDFANQIQLGSKGDLVSVNVPYSTGSSSLEYIDFFEALKRIQSQISRAEKAGEKLNWDIYKNSLTSGIRHYLVRSTRQPLPNLEFKFIAANSLIKLEQGQTDLFADPDLDVKLQDLRDKYFNARKHHTKKEYQEKYYKLTTGQISMFEDERTRQLKSFDPFKNRIAADFFDSHIMFGINDGFDAVIGNPPYIHFEKMEKTIRDFYKNNSKKFGFTTYAARGDMYTLFYEKGVQLLKEGGFLSFITSNKWMRAGYGEKLRDFFLKETNPIELIDLGAGMFESATVDTNILLLQKGENRHRLKALTLGEDGSENMSDYIRRHAVSIDYKVGESWTILSEIEQSIKKKIEAVGTPLKDWDIKINRGILTGLNEAFIISKEKRDELVEADPKSAEIIRPILRGRDIKRYEVNFQNLYLINTHNGYVSEDGETVPPINVDDYPAIKDWLENGNWNTKPKLGTNIERLTKRTDQGVTPYNLRSLAYMDDFSKLKILFSEIVQSPQFYLDENNFIMNDTVTFISGLQLEYLVKYLNSRIIFSIYKSFYAGGGLGTIGIRVKKTFLQNLPIPKIQINSVKDEDIEKEVQEIIGLSSHEVHHLSEM